jgi:hypothetical protein
MGLEETPGDLVAEVVRTWVPIVAGEGAARCARSSLAGVPMGAGVVVGARGEVRRVGAALGRVAPIVGARVAVIAVQRLTDAGTGDADITLGAQVAVAAPGPGPVPVQGLEAAAIGAQAGVCRARVLVLAGEAIDVPIAVIVDAVAKLGLRL